MKDKKDDRARGKEICSVTRCTRCVAQHHLRSSVHARNRAIRRPEKVLEFFCLFASTAKSSKCEMQMQLVRETQDGVPPHQANP